MFRSAYSPRKLKLPHSHLSGASVKLWVQFSLDHRLSPGDHTQLNLVETHPKDFFTEKWKLSCQLLPDTSLAPFSGHLWDSLGVRVVEQTTAWDGWSTWLVCLVHRTEKVSRLSPSVPLFYLPPPTPCCISPPAFPPTPLMSASFLRHVCIRDKPWAARRNECKSVIFGHRKITVSLFFPQTQLRSGRYQLLEDVCGHFNLLEYQCKSLLSPFNCS